MRLIFHAKQLAALDRKAQGIASEIKAKGESRGSMVFIDRKIYRETRRKHGLPVGLGDTIAKATKAVGIKPCKGCRKRQAKLNRLVPY
tara:strand:- start:1043 stop:1306 length:264 start_codon:yes stop_codon:yes gene_type:complete